MSKRASTLERLQSLIDLCRNNRSSWTSRGACAIRALHLSKLSKFDLEAFETRVLLSATPDGLAELLTPTAAGSESGAVVINTSESTSSDAKSSEVTVNPFERLEPSGGLIFASGDNTGTIPAPGDSETFTFDVDPGQTITVIVDPDPTLLPTVDLADPDQGSIGFASGGAPGSDAVLQAVPTPARALIRSPSAVRREPPATTTCKSSSTPRPR